MEIDKVVEGHLLILEQEMQFDEKTESITIGDNHVQLGKKILKYKDKLKVKSNNPCSLID